MNTQKVKNSKRARRRVRVRKKVSGTSERPRASVFRSLKHLSCQLVDDEAGRTLLGLSTRSAAFREAAQAENLSGGNCKAAELLGRMVAGKAVEIGVRKIVFDRAGCKYHGRLKALAESMRKNGLSF